MLSVPACGRGLFAAVIAIALLVMSLPVSAAPAQQHGIGLGKGHAKDTVIVGFEPGVSAVKRGRIGRELGAESTRRVSPLARDTVVMELPPGQSVEQAIRKLERQAGVEYAEPDYVVSRAATSDDTRYSDLWGMHGDASTPSNQYGSGAAEAWAAGAIGRSEVYVAVLDEGLETGHPDLAQNIDVARSWDVLSNDDAVYDGPGYWHGSHVAGTIGARGGNDLGVAGVNWRVKMISVKMLGPEPNAGYLTETIAAIDYVTALKLAGLNVVAINASWGYEGEPSMAALAAVKRAGDAGLLFVAAAGNYGDDLDGPIYPDFPAVSFYPAAYDCSTTTSGAPRGWDCIISVANLTATGGMAGDSNHGTTSVDLGAPGTSILSTRSGGYGYSSGTSMAAPHVTGAIALCASLDPGAGPATLRDRLMTTVTPTPSMADTVTGGRLDVGALATACGAGSQVVVPDLVGDDEDSVASTLASAGLTAGTRTTAYHQSVPAGRVVSSYPVAGSALVAGSPVDYLVSRGPAPSATFVDDLSTRFVRKGSGWKQAWFGYAGHHFWAPTRSSPAVRIGKWKPVLPAPGTYRVVAKLPTKHATTRKAKYRIKTASGWVTRVRNQYKRRGDWVSLGIHRLTTTPVVKLTDRTGEAASRGRAVAFDAIKFVPVVSTTAVPASSPGPDAEAEPGSIEPAVTTTSPLDPLGDRVDAPESEDQVETNPGGDPNLGLDRDLAEPAEPDQPAEPDLPAKDPKPDQPTESDLPAKDPKPDQPTESAEPDQPAKPDETAEPDLPAKPDQPTESDLPAKDPKPDQPAEPDKTTAPDKAPQSGDRAASDQAFEPDKPSKGPKPDQPGKPDGPDKPAKDPEPKLEQPDRDPKPAPPDRTRRDEVLILDPATVLLTVGESQPVSAFLCPDGALGPGPDGEFATSDDACRRAASARWSAADPSVVELVERKVGDRGARAKQTVLVALAPTESSLTATAGKLEATSELIVVPAA